MCTKLVPINEVSMDIKSEYGREYGTIGTKLELLRLSSSSHKTNNLLTSIKDFVRSASVKPVVSEHATREYGYFVKLKHYS